MAALHKAGIKHLDIKPANTLLNHRGDPKSARICDFGIARDAATANDDDSVGTPGYQVRLINGMMSVRDMPRVCAEYVSLPTPRIYLLSPLMPGNPDYCICLTFSEPRTH